MPTTSPRRRVTTPRPLADVTALPARGHDGHRTRSRDAHPAGRAGPRPAPGRPEPGQLAGLLVRLTAEVAAGRRPLRQLEAVLAPTLARRLTLGLRPGVARPQEPPVVIRTVAGPPTPSGAVEVTVLIERGGRVTAVAVRLERHHGAWRATELTAPEDGYAPLPTRSSPREERGLDAFDEAALEADAAAGAVSPRRGSA